MPKKKTKEKPAAPTVSEGKVCREIIDRNEVLGAQVMTVVMELLGDTVTRGDYAKLKKHIDATVSVHTDNLVTQVGKYFAGP